MNESPGIESRLCQVVLRWSFWSDILKYVEKDRQPLLGQCRKGSDHEACVKICQRKQQQLQEEFQALLQKIDPTEIQVIIERIQRELRVNADDLDFLISFGRQ